MSAPHLLDTLPFDDQLVLDEDVASVFTIEPHFLVLYWQLQPMMGFESSSISTLVLFVSFVVALFPVRCSQRFEWRTKLLGNRSDPSLSGGDRQLEPQTTGPGQRSRSSLHRDADILASSRLDLRRVQGPEIAKIV